MPLLRGGRPLKRWVWVGAFGADVMLCAGCAYVGPVAQSWWAVWDRKQLVERTVRRRLDVSPSGVRVPGVMELSVVAAGEPVEVLSPHGAQYAWTRKRPVRVRGRAAGREIDAFGLVDESAGYHARVTSWRWSAGVGVAESGAAVTWNLVDGLHDGPERSERAVWTGGVPRPVGPARFGGLDTVSSADGVDLRFTTEARRARRDRLLLVSSDYEQPFGTFSGSLPGVGRLREGWGVMERHDARW